MRQERTPSLVGLRMSRTCAPAEHYFECRRPAEALANVPLDIEFSWLAQSGSAPSDSSPRLRGPLQNEQGASTTAQSGRLLLGSQASSIHRCMCPDSGLGLSSPPITSEVPARAGTLVRSRIHILAIPGRTSPSLSLGSATVGSCGSSLALRGAWICVCAGHAWQVRVCLEKRSRCPTPRVAVSIRSAGLGALPCWRRPCVVLVCAK